MWDWHCCSYCFLVVFVSWSLFSVFVFPSLEFPVSGWGSVNLTLPFLNHENGDFLILTRDLCPSRLLITVACQVLWMLWLLIGYFIQCFDVLYAKLLFCIHCSCNPCGFLILCYSISCAWIPFSSVGMLMNLTLIPWTMLYRNIFHCSSSHWHCSGLEDSSQWQASSKCQRIEGELSKFVVQALWRETAAQGDLCHTYGQVKLSVFNLLCWNRGRLLW